MHQGSPLGKLPTMALRYRPRWCRRCRVAGTSAEPISYNGWCATCGVERMADAVTQIADGAGPIRDKWLRNTVAALQRQVDADASEVNDA